MRITADGDGDVATAGQLVTVHYTGWLHDPAAVDGRGQKFDSSVDRGQYFEFPLGARRVIQGWDQGVAGMRIGETRELLIAPDLEAGNMIAKQLIYLAGADAAGIVLGARVPIVLTSRADNVFSRLASTAIAQRFVHQKLEGAVS